MKVKPKKVSLRLSSDVPPPTSKHPDSPFPPSDCGSTEIHRVHVMLSTTKSLQNEIDSLDLKNIHAVWRDQEEKINKILREKGLVSK